MWNRVKTETFQKVQKKFDLDLDLGFRTKLSMSRIPYEGAPVSQTPAVSLFFQIATISSFSFINVNYFTYDRYFKAHIPVYYGSEETWMDIWENYAQQRVLLNG